MEVIVFGFFAAIVGGFCGACAAGLWWAFVQLGLPGAPPAPEQVRALMLIGAILAPAMFGSFLLWALRK